MLFNRDRPLGKTEARREAKRKRVSLADAPRGKRIAIWVFFHLLWLGILTAIAMVLGSVVLEMLGQP